MINQIRGFNQRAKSRQCSIDSEAIEMREAIGFCLNAKPLAAAPQTFQHVVQLRGGRRTGRICPNPDVFNDGCVLSLPQIGRTREQGQTTISTEIETLEKTESKRVISRQVIHALLLKQQHAIKAAFRHGGGRPCNTALKFFPCKMQRHHALNAIAETNRP